MTKPDLGKILNPRDRAMLDAQLGTTWIPKKPRELILPYSDATAEREKPSSVSALQNKSQEVYDGYGDLIEQCREMEEEIELQCVGVEVPLDESNNKLAVDAVKRVFGTDGRVITFDMYKRVVHALAELTNSQMPRP